MVSKAWHMMKMFCEKRWSELEKKGGNAGIMCIEAAHCVTKIVSYSLNCNLWFKSSIMFQIAKCLVLFLEPDPKRTPVLKFVIFSKISTKWLKIDVFNQYIIFIGSKWTFWIRKLFWEILRTWVTTRQSFFRKWIMR